MTAPAASVLIPTHDREYLLDFAIDSALAQTVPVEVIVIGDGVTEAVRETVLRRASDPRVRFLDRPKADFHGESYRHEAILAASSDAIFYLCDDDLFLPTHVGELLELLADHDLVQARNAGVLPDGSLWPYPGDLSDPRAREILLDDVNRHNFVSITGTAHSRAAYLRLADPWEATPEGYWPDHYQFRKFLRAAWFRGATSEHVTAIQFPTLQFGREEWSAARRIAETSAWSARLDEPGLRDELDRRWVIAASRRGAELEWTLLARTVSLGVAGQELDGIGHALADRDAELSWMRNSVSWRVTAPLRAIRRRFPRG